MARKLAPIHPGEILREEFLSPLGISNYRLAKEIGAVPPSAHVALCRMVIGLLDIALPEPESTTRFATMAALREKLWFTQVMRPFRSVTITAASIVFAISASFS